MAASEVDVLVGAGVCIVVDGREAKNCLTPGGSSRIQALPCRAEGAEQGSCNRYRLGAEREPADFHADRPCYRELMEPDLGSSRY